jgi:hypothetical protein
VVAPAVELAASGAEGAADSGRGPADSLEFGIALILGGLEKKLATAR